MSSPLKPSQALPEQAKKARNKVAKQGAAVRKARAQVHKALKGRVANLPHKPVPMSRFIQNYKPYLDESERSGWYVVLSQRGGKSDFVLAPEKQVRDSLEATEFLAAALMSVAASGEMTHVFAEGLVDSLPWVSFLPAEDRDVFVAEAVEMLHAASSLGRFTAFADLIEDWRATAELWSDPDLAASLSEDIEEPLDLPVELPAQ